MKIRAATREDIAELRELIDASVRGLSQGHYSAAEIEAGLAEIFGVDTQLIEDGTYFVAVGDGGQIAGCGGWSRRKTLYGSDLRKGSGPDIQLDPRTDAARIRAFFVRPEFARRGIGRAILRACEEAAAARGFRRLELMATLPGVPLYEAMGYSRLEPFAIPLRGGGSLAAFRMAKAGVRSE